MEKSQGLVFKILTFPKRAEFGKGRDRLDLCLEATLVVELRAALIVLTIFRYCDWHDFHISTILTLYILTIIHCCYWYDSCMSTIIALINTVSGSQVPESGNFRLCGALWWRFYGPIGFVVTCTTPNCKPETLNPQASTPRGHTSLNLFP